MIERRKLVIVISQLHGGGAERVTARLASALLERGWSIVLATLHGQSPADYWVDPGVVRRSIDLGFASKSRVQAVFANLRRTIALRRLLRTERPDVVLGMMTNTAILTILASVSMGLRVVVAERVYPPKSTDSRVWSLLRRMTYRLADTVVVQAERGAIWLHENCPGVDTRVIPNSVQSKSWLEARDLHESNRADNSREPIVLAAGRLTEQKGFDLLISAFSSIAAIHPTWRMVILGQGEERPKLEQMVSAARLSDRVLLPGRVDDMFSWYARARIFCLSSRFEGFPNVLLEAMSGGCAVVSFDCPTGPAEIVRDDDNGILVSLESGVQGLATSLDRVMTDRALCQRLASRARADTVRFSEERIVEMWHSALSGTTAP